MACCFVCGADTPHTLRLPGLLSTIPPGKRGRLPFCTAHERDAYTRRDGPRGKQGAAGEQPEPRTGGAVSGGASDVVQGALDL